MFKRSNIAVESAFALCNIPPNGSARLRPKLAGHGRASFAAEQPLFAPGASHMRRISHWRARAAVCLLSALCLLVFSAFVAGPPPLRAGNITISDTGKGGTGIRNTDGFDVKTDANGAFTGVYFNQFNRNTVISDLNFMLKAGGTEEKATITGTGTPFFSNAAGTKFSFHFFQGGTGTGVSFNHRFAVAMTGFVANQEYIVTASVPEPSTIVISVTALVFGLGVAWRHRKRVTARP
jgi:hypothetical protein